MATITLATLRSRTRQKADMENSTFVSDSEANQYVNTAIEHLVDTVELANSDHYLRSVDFTLSAGADAYALPPSVVYLLRGVDYVADTTTSYTLQPFIFAERNQDQGGFSSSGQPPYRYQWRQNDLKITPAPTSSSTFRVWFVPVQANLAQDTDTFDFYNGWDQFVVVDAAIQCLQKEESDTTLLLAERARLETKILAAAKRRDLSSPKYVTDVYSLNNRWRRY